MKKVLPAILSLVLVLSLCGIFACAQANNAAAGKSYVLNGLMDGLYQDDSSNKLTNGEYASTSRYSDTAYVGLNANSEYYGANGCVSVIVDLGENVNVGNVAISVSNHADAGIAAPSEIKVSVSADNSVWSEGVVLEYETALEAGTIVRAIGIINVTGRYVKFEMLPTDGNVWMFVDEVEVYDDGEPGGDIPSGNESASDTSAFADTSVPGTESVSDDISSAVSSGVSETGPEDNNTVLWVVLGAVAIAVIVAVLVVASRKKK